MFEKDGLMQPMKQIYFDVPQLFAQSSLGMYFIHALYLRNDVDIFKHESIQIIVQEHWEAWSSKNFWFQGFPMGTLIFFFTVWSNILIINHTRVDPGFMLFWEICTVCLAVYFEILIIVEFLKTKYVFKFMTKEISQMFSANNLTKWFMPLLICSSIIYSNHLGFDDLS